MGGREGINAMQHLFDEEWDKFDKDNDGQLDSSEFEDFILQCHGRLGEFMPSEDVMEELLQQIISENKMVHKNDFKRYIQSGALALDGNLSRPTTEPWWPVPVSSAA